jgi:hypothetical protein
LDGIAGWAKMKKHKVYCGWINPKRDLRNDSGFDRVTVYTQKSEREFPCKITVEWTEPKLKKRKSK